MAATDLDRGPSRAHLVPIAVLGSVSAVTFGLVAWMIEGGWGLTRVDDDVLRFEVDHRTGWLTDAFQVLTHLGSVLTLALIAGAVGALLLWQRRDWLSSLMLVLALALSIVTKNALKTAFGRSRPPAVDQMGANSGYAFPSGHAADAMAVFGMVAVVLSLGQRPGVRAAFWIVAMGLALLVGETRLYLGAHWLTDVLGGYAESGTLVALITLAAEAARRRRLRTPPEAPVRTARCPPARGP
jgi:membrane-associated phospholipid phosphatase